MFRSTVTLVALSLAFGLLSSGCHKPCNCGNRTKMNDRQTVSKYGSGITIDKGYITKVQPLDPSYFPGNLSKENRLEHIRYWHGKNVLVTGTITEVCPKKGCWLRLAGRSPEGLFVKFTCPIEGRLIPMDAVGREILVQGVFYFEEISEEQARHYAEDAKKSPEEIAAIVGPQKIARIEATGAEIQGL